MLSRPSDRHSHSPQGSTPHLYYCKDKQKETVNFSSKVVAARTHILDVILDRCVQGLVLDV